MDFSFIMFVVYSFMSKIFTMAIPDNSFMKVASTITIFCDFGAISIVITGKNGIDLLRKLKHESPESITPSNSKIFFHSHDQIYIIMNFGYQSKNFESMTMYIYNHWDYKKYTNILSLSHLNSLSIGRELW